jgi:hypothetical protein
VEHFGVELANDVWAVVAEKVVADGVALASEVVGQERVTGSQPRDLGAADGRDVSGKCGGSVSRS